jgi:hypothetical protein
VASVCDPLSPGLSMCLELFLSSGFHSKTGYVACGIVTQLHLNNCNDIGNTRHYSKHKLEEVVLLPVPLPLRIVKPGRASNNGLIEHKGIGTRSSKCKSVLSFQRPCYDNKSSYFVTAILAQQYQPCGHVRSCILWQYPGTSTRPISTLQR